MIRTLEFLALDWLCVVAAVAIGFCGTLDAQEVAPAGYQSGAPTAPPETSGQAFVVVSKVFAADQSDPVQHHRLIFDSGVTYDLDRLSDQEMCVYDPANKQITLLDRHRRFKAIVGTNDLITLVATVKAEAQKAKADVGLHAQVTVDGDRLTIGFAKARYAMTTQPAAEPWMAADFASVTDLVSKMNLLRKRGLPPFARMKLGDHVAALGQLPDETTLLVRHGRQSSTLRATLSVETVGPEDQQRILEARGMMSAFETVSFQQFDRAQ